ncbi:hypothetical protein VSU19_22865 [Verrucomicrobiales bacterium BCK34]|nr:hypothetical protein [Verrucomicrobiales bacterium BCK34]
MKAYEIFQELKPETAASVFQYLRDEQREVYTASLSSLAANRKLRPVFIQRKPAPAQIEWLVKNVKLRGSGEIAEHVIQLWLMKGHQDVLVGFLDGLGVEHDGEGAADDIPDEFDKKKLKSTVEKLLKDHDPEIVKAYIHVFQLQRYEGWPEITELIAATPALQFGEPAPAATAEATEEPKAEAEAAEEAAPAKKAPAKKAASKKAAKAESEKSGDEEK